MASDQGTKTNVKNKILPNEKAKDRVLDGPSSLGHPVLVFVGPPNQKSLI